MGAITVSLAEKDILHLVLEFMENRKLFISQASLERETGVINGQYSSDTLFLRQVILDGQWDTALDFVQPLRVTMEFDVKQFEYLIIKHKYYELICVNQEPGPLQNNEFTIEEVLECLRLLECLAPSKKEYNELCLLLTLPKLADHTGFRNWNPSNARAECFAAVYPLVKPFLPLDKKDLSTAYAKDDRLIQLVTKGLFYESCVELCQNKAIRHSIHDEQLSFSSLLNGHKLSSPDISLLTWLEVVPDEVFSLPFEQKALQVRITEHRKPELNACWTEQILQTPIKPNKFPHAAVPTAKFRAAEKLSMSMMPQYEYNSGLCTSLQIDPKTPGNNVFHVGNSSSSSTFTRSLLLDIGGGGRLSQSVVSTVPSFQITQKVATPVADGAQQKSQQPEVNNSTQQQFQANNPAAAMMQQSIDHLLATGDAIATTGGSEQQFFEDSALDGRAAMQKSVYDQLEDIKAKTLQATSVKERGAPVRNKTSSLSTSSYSVLQAPTLPPLPELLGSSEEMAANDPSIENDNTKLYTQFIKQRMQSQPPDTVTPPQSPSAGMKYLMIKSQMETRGVSDMDRSIMDHSVKVSSAVKSTENEKSLQFVAVSRLEDSQAIRAVAFHPSGKLYAVGTNSRQLHLCAYPDYIKNIRKDHVTRTPEILLTRPKQHKGSVYCVGFNPTGDLLATGSNDKSIQLLSFNESKCKVGSEMELAMHDGTVRDIVFIEDTTNRSSLMVSGGAGNCRIYVTDCASGRSLLNLQGHSAPILGLCSWGGCLFASCSQDRTIRFWDLRCSAAVNVISPGPRTPSFPVTSVCVDPSGRLLVSGHEDASVMLFDVSGSRVIQMFKPHTSEVRTVRFSPGTYYLLSGSYDNRIILTDLRGELTGPLTYLPVAMHDDKVIQVRWNPQEFTFLSTSADRRVTLWALPQR